MVRQRLDSVFAALADPTRRRMLERLARGPMSIGQMAKGFSISQPGISKHVKILECAGLLKREIVGRVHECRLEPATLQGVSSWLDRQERFWSATLDRLDSYFTDSSSAKRKNRS
jgi:DNA-binding transcriptional ArsR family regulator